MSQSNSMPNHIVEERQDVIFRKVRGILNKITPETFDKLSKELVNVGLDSPRTLRGVIYLLFDKALKDLKYSSLYAKLCQELSEKAPNFEQDHVGTNTFCKFLISKCEDEFERRRKATEHFDTKNELTDEEYEQRAIAKQKMLGNIKFICELGKKRLLQEEILHECIRGLLSKKRERPIQDQAQDLECLCQIMRTIGSLLDIQASRNLMNQYFERIDMFTKKPDLPSRIRFMLRDVIDLRNNNWRPRPFQREDNVPLPLSKLREKAGYDPTASSSIDKFGNNRNLIGIGDLSKLHGNKLSLLLDDEPRFTTTTDFHWGPAFLDQQFDAFSSGGMTGPKQNTPFKVPMPNDNPPSTAAPTYMKSNIFQHNSPASDSAAIKRFERQSVASNPQAVASHPLSKQINEPRKHFDGSGFDRRPFSDTKQSTVNTRNDTDYMGPHKSPMNINVPKEQQYEELPLNAHRRPGDVRQVSRPGFNPPGPRPIIRRNPPDMNQRPLPPFVHQQQNQQNLRFEFRSPQGDVQDGRDRRFHRPEFNHPEHQDQRHPRFNNNAHYRQDRNDRPPISRESQHFDRSNQTESELNFNWRDRTNKANPVNKSNNIAQSPSNQSNVQKPSASHHTDHYNESRLDSDKSTTSIRNINLNNSANPIVINNRQSEDMHVMNRQPPIEKPTGIARNMVDPMAANFIRPNPHVAPILGNEQVFSGKVPNINRIVDTRHPVRERELSPVKSVTRRAQEYEPLPAATSQLPLNQNQRQQARSTHLDNSDTRESRRVYQSVPQIRDEPQDQKIYNNGFSQERNYNRPPINRNQKPESIEHDRANWRRGPILPNNNVVKDQPTPNLSPLLPKPLSKLSDTIFSLRPSHNLAGRASITSTNPARKSDSIEGDQNKDTREVPDIMKNAGKPEVVQVPPHPTELPPVKIGDAVEVGDSRPEILSSSPTRAAARDFHVNKFLSVLTETTSENALNINRITSKIKDLKIPKSYQHECLVSAMKQSILKSENDRDNIGKLTYQLIPSIFETASLLNAFKMIFEQMHALEVETPKVKSLVAGFLSRATLDGLVSLEEVGNILAGGKHHPLFLLFLQNLDKSAGQAWLNEKFIVSKVNLMDMLPEIDRSKDRLASILKDRCLGFLDPMLTIEPDLWEQMKERDPSPAAVYRWIKDNVDQTIQNSPTFAHVLISCLLRYIYNAAVEKAKATLSDQNIEDPDSSKSSPTSTSPSTMDAESELLSKYQQVLQAILKDKQMQLATLYALQSFYHGLDFPKGSLLRWFHMFYDMNIVDDDVFFIWKEEINDEFPGKGQALFQVNTWLNWLAEAESEEEEDV